MHRLLLELPSKLESKRLILRPYHAGDGGAFFHMLEHGNREHLKALGTIFGSKKAKEVEIWVRERAADWVTRTRFVISFWEKGSGSFLGHIWIEPVDWDIPHFEMGWFVDKNHQGQGFVTEAAKRSLTFLFKDLHAHKVTARVREHGPHKEKSKHVAEQCGFLKEGFLRDTVKLEDSGELISETYYGLLRADTAVRNGTRKQVNRR